MFRLIVAKGHPATSRIALSAAHQVQFQVPALARLSAAGLSQSRAVSSSTSKNSDVVRDQQNAAHGPRSDEEMQKLQNLVVMPPEHIEESLASLAQEAVPADPLDLAYAGPAKPQAAKIALAFDDPKQAFASKSTFELIRAWVIFKICSWKWFVDRSGTLLKLANKVSPTLTNFAVRNTFFAHFCAGEDMETLRPTVSKLREAGIGSIMDYAAEADVDVAPEHIRDENEPARRYDYVSEEACDINLENFKDCIRAVHNVSPAGIAAIKMTALGLPALLERMTCAINETQRLFRAMDTGNKGLLSLAEFNMALKRIFPGLSERDLNNLFLTIDTDEDKVIDYVEWSNSLRMEEVWRLISSAGDSFEIPDIGRTMLDSEELQLMQNMQRRIDELVSLAAELDVRIMIDAEQTYFQPAIDSVALALQLKYNKVKPVVFNTYQCYLKDSVTRISQDLIRAQRGQYRFAAKLVRGAYMHSERARAKEHGYPDPIHDTIEDTHRAYHQAIDMILQQKGAHLLIASHNQASIEYTVHQMDLLGLKPGHGIEDTSVCFAQLLGMSDHLTYTLGKNGYRAYKYVPYGPVQEVIPYLVRRAQENSDLLGNAGAERGMLLSEIRRRLVGV